LCDAQALFLQRPEDPFSVGQQLGSLTVAHEDELDVGRDWALGFFTAVMLREQDWDLWLDEHDWVEEIFDQLPDPEDPELSPDDGVIVQDLLSALFVAAGDLAKKPRDASAVVSAADVTDRLERLSLPFGFEPATWRNLVALATNLHDALVETDEEHRLDDDELREQARALRDTLRRYV